MSIAVNGWVYSRAAYPTNTSSDCLKVQYLLRTWHASTRPRTLELDPACRWTRLAVLATHGGGLFDTAGTVSFRAVYVLGGRRHVLDETSRFVREAKRWPTSGQ